MQTIQWDNFIAVTIGSLPTAGTLMNNGMAVAEGQHISTADVSAGLLVFLPAANVNFTFQAAALNGTL